MRYAIAILLTSLALFLSQYMRPIVFLLPFAAVVASALIGRTGPSVLATVIATLGIAYFYTPPLHSFLIPDPADRIHLAVFLILSSLSSLVTSHFRRLYDFQKSVRLELDGRARELSAVIESTNTRLALLDNNFTFLMVNTAYIRGSGFTQEQLLGHNHFEYFPHTENEANFKRVRDTGEPYAVTEKPFFFVHRPERGITYWNWSLVPIKNPQGATERLLLSATEVTQQVRLRYEFAELAESAQRQAATLDAAIASILHGIIIYDPSGNVLRMNAAASSILGYSPEQIKQSLEQRLSNLKLMSEAEVPIRAEDSPPMRALRGETIQGMILAIVRQGKTTWLSISAAPVKSAKGKVTGAAVAFADITHLRELQRNQENVLHVLSHDLRLPLTVIHSQTELIDRTIHDSRLNGKLSRSTELIRMSTRQINSMIQELIDLAGISGGPLILNTQPLDLAQWIRALLERMKAPLELRRIAVDIDSGLPLVSADPDRLERILLNLLTNALKYAGPGTLIRIHALKTDHEVAVSVIDQGAGIPPEDLPHVFERFYRAKEKRKIAGVGLGLYIVKNLVEAHHGRVWVKSTVGKGTEFTFTLPISDQQERGRPTGWLKFEG